MGQALLIVVMLAVTLSGCATVGNEAILDDQTVGQIQIGQTTKEQVEALFGKPTMIGTQELDGVRSDVWSYGYADVSPFGSAKSAGLTMTFRPDGTVNGVSRIYNDASGQPGRMDTKAAR